MIVGYNYELWDGKKVVGTINVPYTFFGREALFFDSSILKQKYRKKYKIIKVPLTQRIVSRTATDVTYRTCLDVKRKSKRQIEVIKRCYL